MHILTKKNSLLASSGAEILEGGWGAESAPLATHNNQGVGTERVNKMFENAPNYRCEERRKEKNKNEEAKIENMKNKLKIKEKKVMFSYCNYKVQGRIWGGGMLG